MNDESTHDREPEWLHGHPHDPNPASPPDDGTIVLAAAGREQRFTVEFLRTLPTTYSAGCYIVSTGHGISGPFTFAGVTLADLFAHMLPADFAWRYVDIVSGDGFGTRLAPADLAVSTQDRPPLLAHTVDQMPLTRAAGLVRLIVPAETDDALKQVKWIARIEVTSA